MKNKQDISLEHLRTSSIRVSKFHFAYVLLFFIQTVVYHASKVITPDLLLKRWVAGAALLAISVLAWLVARHRSTVSTGYQLAISGLILADIAFAAFNVYTQRGYASKSVLLFVVPIIVATTLVNRSALVATAIISVAVYSTTAISYFVLNFNEGYMAELYGEIGFYSALLLMSAGLLWTTIHKRK